MFNQIGPLELGIVLVIVLVIFGPKRLPGLGKALGGGMRDFKDAITGKDRGGNDDDESDEREKPAALEAAPKADAETQPEPEPERVSEPR